MVILCLLNNYTHIRTWKQHDIVRNKGTRNCGFPLDRQTDRQTDTQAGHLRGETGNSQN